MSAPRVACAARWPQRRRSGSGLLRRPAIATWTFVCVGVHSSGYSPSPARLPPPEGSADCARCENCGCRALGLCLGTPSRVKLRHGPQPPQGRDVYPAALVGVGASGNNVVRHGEPGSSRSAHVLERTEPAALVDSSGEKSSDWIFTSDCEVSEPSFEKSKRRVSLSAHFGHQASAPAPGRMPAGVRATTAMCAQRPGPSSRANVRC